MRMDYDKKKDILKIVLSTTPVKKSSFDNPGVVLGYGSDGTLVSLEIREASRKVENPKLVDISVNGRNVQGLTLF